MPVLHATFLDLILSPGTGVEARDPRQVAVVVSLVLLVVEVRVMGRLVVEVRVTGLLAVVAEALAV